MFSDEQIRFILSRVAGWANRYFWRKIDNIFMGDGTYVATDKVRARDGDGLKLVDDADNGIFVEDGGQVGIGTTSPDGILHVHSASAGSVTADTNADELVVESSGDGGISILAGDSNIGSIYFGQPADSIAAYFQWQAASNLLRCGTGHTDGTIQIDSGVGTLALYIDASQNIGINRSSIGGKLHVDQASTTAAIPVLVLDQADIDEPLIEIEGTIGTGNTVEAVGAKTLTTTHFIMVELPGGLIRYIPCGTIA